MPEAKSRRLTRRERLTSQADVLLLRENAVTNGIEWVRSVRVG